MTEYDTARCVIGSKPHSAEVGYVCTQHLERLASTVRTIEYEAQQLDARPSMEMRTGGGKGGLASERTPVRIDVIAFLDPRTRRWEPDTEQTYTAPQPKAFGPWCLFCDHETCTAWRAGRRRDLHDDEHDAGSASLASVLDELHNWARLIREERDLMPPDVVTVASERDTLSRHLDWCAEQEWIDEMYTDLLKLLAQLQSMNGTAPEKPVGRCYLIEDGELCNGPIWVDEAAGHAHCGRCRNTWDGTRIAALRWELEMAKRPKGQDGNPMLTAEEIATRRGLSVNAVRLRLSRNGAKVVGGSYYDPAWLTHRVDVAS